MAGGSGRIPQPSGHRHNDPRFGLRMTGRRIFANQLSQMFHIARRKVGLAEHGPALSVAAFQKPEGP